MRKYSLLLSLLVYNTINAQKSVKITYEQNIFYSDAFFNQVPGGVSEEFKAAFRKPKTFELINNGDNSLFKSAIEKEIVIPSAEANSETSINKGTFIKPFNVWILKDFTKQFIIKSTTVEDQEYYVEQSFLVEDIRYDKRTRVIDGYTCLSAFSVSAKNDTIQYWYTQEIPIIDGPFTMTTIPGLVLCTESKKKVIYVTKIEFFDKKLVIDGVNKNTPFVSELELKNKIEESRKPKSFTDEFGKKFESNTVIIKAGN